jgi:hypothetical protein
VAGDDLLAGASLTDDQHGGVARREQANPPQQILRLRIFKNQRFGPDRQGPGVGIRESQDWHVTPNVR